MKILILSTFGNYGGAAVCSKRLKTSLAKHGVEVTLGVVHAYDGTSSISVIHNHFFQFLRKWALFILERLQVLLAISKHKYLYKYSTGRIGLNVLDSSLVREADLVHLHWINFGFLDIEQIGRLAKEKPVLWTLHDMWAFTGGCHYTMGCTLYRKGCEKCFYLKNSSLSKQVQARKIQHWSDVSFKVVATSKWLADCASESTVFKNRQIEVLSTPIDTSIFYPMEKEPIRKKYHLPANQHFVLVGAVDLSDVRKGFQYLKEALEWLSGKLPNIHLLTFGKLDEELVRGMESTSFGQVRDLATLNEIYNLADVFALSSVQDNLPNTAMEALSCGLPVAAFDCGGVSDMVQTGETGYLAENGNPEDLGRGILELLTSSQREKLSSNGREKVLKNYAEDVIVKQHLAVYQELIAER